MVWPLIAIAAVTAAAQYYQSEKARGASKDRLKQLERDFNDLVPPGYDMSVMDPPAVLKQRLESPKFDGDITPKMSAFVEETAPEIVRETGDMKTGRQAQIDALRGLQSAAANRNDPELMQALSEASGNAMSDARAREGAVRDQFARRGQANSTMALISQLQSNASAMDREAASGQRAAAEAYRNRLNALKSSADLGGNIRSADEGLQTRNAGIINDFNERTSRNRQNWENQRSNVINSAERQNLDRRDMLSKYGYEQQKSERDRMDRIAADDSKWRAAERDRVNKLKSQAYGDEVAKAERKAGLATQYNTLESENTRDRNNLYQGAGQAATGIYKESRREDDEDEEKSKWG